MLMTVQECGQGVNKDVPAWELAPGVWSDLLNARSRNGVTRKRKGFTAAYSTPTVAPYALFQYETSAARFLVQAGLTKVFVDDGSTRTEITGTSLTGGVDDRLSGGDYNGVFILNSPVDGPFYWNGDTATNLAALTNWPASYLADVMRPFKDYLFAGSVFDGTQKLPQLVMWSQSAEAGSIPSSWAAASTNDAGDDPFSGVGGMVDFCALGDVLIAYGQKGRVAIQYIGGNDVFSFTRLPGNDGLLAKNCVVATPAGHVFLAAGDVMLHAGGMAESIADGTIKEWLFSSIDEANAQRAFLCLNREETEVWIVFPSGGSEVCDRIAVWNWKDKTWEIFSAPGLLCAASGLVPSALAALTYSTVTATYDTTTATYSQSEASSTRERLVVATSSAVGLANTGTLDFGASIEAYAERVAIPLSKGQDTVKSLSRMRPRLNAVAGTTVTVRLDTTMNPDDAPSYPASSTYTQGTSTWANQFTKAGRYGAVRIEFEGEEAAGLRSYQLEMPDGGGKF